MFPFGDNAELVGVNMINGLFDGDIGQRNFTALTLAGDQLFPGIGTLANNLHSVFLVLAFSRESKLVLRLPIWDLIDPEPLVGGSQETRKVALDIFDIVELRCQRIIHVNDDDFPVGLLLVQKSHDTENLDLFHLACVTNQLSDLADIQWIIISFRLGLWVDHVGVFPRLPGDISQ